MNIIRYLLSLSVLAVLALGVGLALGGDADIPPEVLTVEPFPGAEIRPDAPVNITFNQAMDQGSVSAQIAPDVAFEATWTDARTLQLTPADSWGRDAEYTVTIPAEAASADGAALPEAYTFTLRTVGDLQVTTTSPAADAESVAADAEITVAFNQPVVPLGSTEDMLDLPSPLSISPEVPGAGEWLNTSIYTFSPSEDLAGGAQYTVTVAGGLEAVDGATLPEDVTFSFTTLAPEILRTVPQDGTTNFLLEDPVAVVFSQPMNQSSVQEAFALTASGARVSGDFAWNDDGTEMTFTPAENLQIGTSYRLVMDASIARGVGGANIRTGRDFTFTTVPLPFVERTSPQDGDSNVPPFGQGVSITFGTPMNPNTFAGKLEISPEPEEWTPRASARSLAAQFTLSPLTDYTIILRAGAEDVYGNPIQQDYTFSFFTGDIPPEFGLPDAGRLIQTGAYRDSTFLAAQVAGMPTADLALYDVPIADLRQLTFDLYREDNGLADPARLVRQWQQSYTRSAGFRIQPVFLTEDGDALAPGLYFLLGQYRPPGEDFTRRYPVGIAVTNTTVTYKRMDGSILVWLTDMQTGEPVPEAPVALYENGVELARSTTGADGTLRLSLDVNPNAFVAVETRTEDRYGVWYTANEPQPPSEDVYVYTERPIYRPGETVFFRGAYRARDDMDFNTQPSVETVFIRATANFGERVLLEENVTLTEFGTFSGEIPLPEDSPIGILELEVITPTQPFALGRTTAQIAEFRVPEFSVTVTPQEDEIIRGEPLRAVVSSEFFSGGPVNDAAVTWVANSTRSFFNYTGPGRYSFADDRLQDDFGGGFATDAEFFDPGFPGGGGGGQQIASGEGTTNDDGELLVSLGGEDQPLPDFGTQTRRVSIEATLNDESGQFISGRDAVIVHPSAVYVGVGINQYFASADEPFTADLITVNPQSDPVGGQRVTATLVRREWEEVPVEGQFGRFEYRQTEEEVASQRVTTDQNGRATVEFTPERPGIYLVRAATRDQLERLHSSSARLYVTGSEYVRWGQPNNRLELIADEDNYTPGDVAEVLVPLSLQGESHLLVSLERDGVISHEVVQVEGATHVVQVPITDEYAPVVYLSIVAVHGIDEDNSVPELREGTRALNVEPVNRRLDVRITPSSENAQPGDEITFDIEARTPQGEPTQAEVGLRMVDAAILTLAPPNSRSPEEHYYSSSGNFTATSVSLSALVDGRLDDAFEPEVIEQALNEARAMGADAELAADFAESAAAPEGMGGGGGGGGGFEDIAIREDFQQTPLWAPHIVTGEDGRASVSVTLPDNLTIWDVQARALTRDTLVDEVALEVASTLPLLVRPATPRFFVVGDEVELAMIVNNNTPDDQTVQTTIEGTGFELLDGEELEQAVEIASGQRARVTWQARILDVSGVDLTFFALGEDGYQDAARPQLATGEDDTIPVYRYTAPDTTGTAGVLREGGSRTEGVSVPPIADTDQGELTLQLDPSLAVTAIDGLDYLQNFEHQCIEQTVSRFLPNIMTYRALRALGVDDPALEARLVAALDFGLDRLRDSQNPDGGWGWFATMRSNPLVTAYAALGLIEAQNIGYYNDESAMLARALDYLRGEFITPTEDTPAWQLNRQAFFFYVFSRDEQQTRLTAAQMQPLFDVRLEMDYYARAYLMQALGTLEGTLSQMEALASDLYSAARLSATGAHWEEDNIDWWNWNTDVRSTAIILSTLVKWNPNNDLLPNVVRWLMIARQGTHWESTQNTAWAVMALTDWMVATRELEGDYAYALTLNDEALAEGDVSPETVREGQTLRVAVGDLLLDELNRVTVVREDGPGALYYTAHLRLRLNAAEVDALDRGIAVSREYFNAAGERVTRAQVGEVITVRLTINSPDVQYYFVLEDPLPAGAEAVDTSLLTASREIAGPQLQRQSDPRFYWWWWIWDTTEIRDESVNLYAERLPAGTYVYSYQMRASVPGRFQTMPSHAYNFYFPEVFGRGDGELFTVTPTEE